MVDKNPKNNIKRSKPVRVPANWQQEVREYLAEQQDYFAEQAIRSGTWESTADPADPRSWATREQYFCFFETLVSTPDIAAAIERQWRRGDEMRDQTVEDTSDSNLISDFAKWWSSKHTNCDFDHHARIAIGLSFVWGPIAHYVQGRAIEEVYEELKLELVEKGRW